MNHHRRYAAIVEPIGACLVGGGAFGQSFLAQARFIRRLSARIAVDLTAEAAGAALAAAGFAKDDIRLCTTPQEAKAAFDAGHAVAAGSLDSVIGLPFHILVEATGHPEAATVHALKAIEAKRHVLLVTKETDSVAGPMLARLAREAGVGVTPVDGDQPALLIDLVTWAETLGFDILCAGKSSEYDFVFDAASGLVSSNGREAHLPDLLEWWSPGGRALRDVSAGRAGVLSQAYPLKAVPDLCEMTLVANACGLGPDAPPFHAPVARVPEAAALLSPDPTHGVLSGRRRLDVFHHLRAPDEASFAGGVFVTIACQDSASWRVLAEKGHAVSADGASAMICLPRHLLGVEAATSVLDLAGLGHSTYPDDYAPRLDLVAVATRDLPAGARLDAVGHHHTIDGVTAEMRPMSPLAEDRTTPYYLVANRLLARPVGKGAAIRLSDLEIATDSPLLTLRRRQDAAFAVGGRHLEEHP
jgi:predicted homoserine dehydrogenase-like protein